MAKIYEVEGDILLSEAEVLAHGIAPGDHFDSGLALALRERWPSLAKDFRHYCRLDHPKAGTIWAWSGVKEDGGTLRVVNLMTQEPAENAVSGHPGKASLENVGHSLRALARHLTQEGLTSLALPRLATGVGGLEWADVKPLIERHLGDVDVTVYVYTLYRKDQKAAEPAAAA